MAEQEVKEQHRKKLLRWTIALISLAVALLASAIIAICIGSVSIPVDQVFAALFSPDLWKVMTGGHASSTDNIIVLEIRLPRILVAALVGASLAVAGVAMQALFRNPMASPYILGLSSGGAFGAAIAIVLGFSLVSGQFAIPIMAFIFTFLTLFLVYGISRTKFGVPVTTLLLAGIAVGAFFAALVSLIKYFSGDKLADIVFWMMGGLWNSNWSLFWMALPFVLVGCLILLVLAREMNLLMLGESQALNLGVNVRQVRFIILIASSLVTAAAVSVSGVIGFVGLIIPHTLRIIMGPDNKILLPASIVGGAVFMIVTDTIARTIISPEELPVGIITALVGAPFFLYLLRARKREIWGW
jgi:iron complex transport system permease protein